MTSFEDVIKVAKKTSVIIITGNPRDGDTLLRSIVSGTNSTGLIDISFNTPLSLAKKTIEEELIESELPEISPALNHLVVRDIVREKINTGSIFGDIMESIGFADSLLEFINTARIAGLTHKDISKLADSYRASAGKWKELSSFLEKYETALEKKKLADEAVILKKAVQFLEDNQPPFNDIKLYIFNDFPNYGLRKQFLEAVNNRIQIEELTAESFNFYGVGAVKNLAGEIFSEEAETEEGIDSTVNLNISPDSRSEAADIVRSLVFDSEGGYSDTAIALSSYRDQINYISDALGDIPAVFTAGIPVSRQPAGIAMLTFIKFLQDRRDAGSFIKIIREANIKYDDITDDGGYYNKNKWIKYIGGVVLSGGPLQWLEALEKNQEKDESKDLKQICQVLKRFNSDFKEIYATDSLPGKIESFRKFPAEWLKNVSEADGEALKSILRAIDEISASAEGYEMEAGEFLDFMERRISSIMINARIPDGKSVTVCPISSAGYVVAKNKYIVGLNGRVFPQIYSSPAFIPDEERKYLNEKFDSSIPGREEKLEKDRSIFRQAVRTSSGSLTLSFSDLDLSEGRKLMPSSFIPEVYETLTGQAGTEKELIEWAAKKELSEEKQIKRADYEKTVIKKGNGSTAGKIFGNYENLFSGADLFNKRRNFKKYTNADGCIIDKKLAGKCGLFASSTEKNLSATKIECFKKCPFLYFLKYILKISPAEELEVDRLMWPDYLKRGEVYHNIYYKFLIKMREEDKLPLTGEKTLNVLLDIAEREIDALEEEIKPPNDYMKQRFSVEVRANLVKWHGREVSDQEEWKPAYFELPIGRQYNDACDPLIEDVISSYLDPERKDISFIGRIDRVDINKNGDIRITDYKTGKLRSEDKKIGNEGDNYQLILYARMLKNAVNLPEGLNVSGNITARYYYSTARGEFGEVKIDMEDMEDYLKELDDTVKEIISDADSGKFMPRPEKGCSPGEYARGCDFYRVCGRMLHYFYKTKMETAGGGD